MGIPVNGKTHMGRVAELPCAVCGEGPVEVHHIRGNHVGLGQRANDYLTIPLCPEHHRGKHGVHGDRRCLMQGKQNEVGLLAETIGKLFYGEI